MTITNKSFECKHTHRIGKLFVSDMIEKWWNWLTPKKLIEINTKKAQQLHKFWQTIKIEFKKRDI